MEESGRALGGTNGQAAHGLKAPIPRNAPAALGKWEPHTLTFVPELAGLTLNGALNLAIDPNRSLGSKTCILVVWHGQEVVLHGRRVFQLATHPDRPAL